MEAINFLLGWTTWLLAIIPVGAGTAVTYFAMSKSFSFDAEYKGICDKRIRQTIKGSIIGMTISGLITVIRTFY